MRLQNKTNYPDKQLQALFQFCDKDLGIKHITVLCENGMGGSADTWSGKRITIKFPVHREYPYKWDISKRVSYANLEERYDLDDKGYYVLKPGEEIKYHIAGYLDYLVLSKEELIVGVMADELRHIWQTKRKPISEWVYGSRKETGAKSKKFGIERDADYYGLRKVREYRKLHAVDIYPEQPDTINAEQK